ncbi:MAG: NRDE family protein [Polyangiaceae bacterium]
MCLVAIAHQMFPEQPLLLGANRDEYFARVEERTWNERGELVGTLREAW